MTIGCVFGLHAAAVVSPGERPMTASPPPRPLVGGARALAAMPGLASPPTSGRMRWSYPREIA